MVALWTADPKELPAVPGAYALYLELQRPLPLPPRRFAGELAAGHYVYCGSAHGPGGIRARCLRHFRLAKKRHWHVDWLTVAAGRRMVAAFPGLGECDLVHRALVRPEISVPLPGFGSSDCRRCPAHLLALVGDPLADLFAGPYQ